MRKRLWVAGLFLALVSAAPAPAQVVLNFGGANPTKIVNQPIAVPGSTQPQQQPIAVPQQRSATGFSLSSIFGKIPFPSPKLLQGQSTFPTPDHLPGKGYLQNFGFSRPAPVEP